MAGGVSSGGISLKFPGRIGQVSTDPFYLCLSLSLSPSLLGPGCGVWQWLLGREREWYSQQSCSQQYFRSILRAVNTHSHNALFLQAPESTL